MGGSCGVQKYTSEPADLVLLRTDPLSQRAAGILEGFQPFSFKAETPQWVLRSERTDGEGTQVPDGACVLLKW
jgi:hypothetical protein